LLGAGCGLLSSDLTTVNLAFPKKTFRVDTADYHVTSSGSVPTVPCTANCSVATGFCTGCTVDCEASSQTCQAHVTVTVTTDYDLAADAPEFQAIADHSVLSVTIDDVKVEISENTLNTPSPALDVYLAPASASSPDDPSAELVGTLDPIPAGQTGTFALRFTDGGREVVKKFMDDFHTPFRVMTSARTTLHAGDPTPSGRLTGAVLATAHAGI
jgi:hypothetical protein